MLHHGFINKTYVEAPNKNFMAIPGKGWVAMIKDRSLHIVEVMVVFLAQRHQDHRSMEMVLYLPGLIQWEVLTCLREVIQAFMLGQTPAQFTLIEYPIPHPQF